MAGFVIAIDGPAGSGKSSVSKELAKRLGFGYLDTGAGYRAFALHRIANPESSIDELVSSFDYKISTDPEGQVVQLDGKDVSLDIRGEAAASAVSSIAREQSVRELQRTDARARIADCELPGIVVEGRDITTVVAPDAQLRVLLTASEAVRLRRRGLEQTESAENLKARDLSDAKVVEFFTPAEGVELVDTSELDFEQSVQAVLKLVEAVQHVR
ncbi:MAG: (d)CMP kinase [Actinomycetota bacterium]